MSQFWQTVYDHRFAVGSSAWYIVSALIVTMPAKGEPSSLYNWFYDFTHLLLNLKPIPAFKQSEQSSQTKDSSGAIQTETAKVTEQSALPLDPKK
jgi:hypothetical protein